MAARRELGLSATAWFFAVGCLVIVWEGAAARLAKYFSAPWRGVSARLLFLISACCAAAALW
jgi:hypothetical protein